MDNHNFSIDVVCHTRWENTKQTNDRRYDEEDRRTAFCLLDEVFVISRVIRRLR